MTKNSTFISETDTKALVRLCGQHVREFLTFLNDPNKPSYFSKGNNPLINLYKVEPSIIDKARQFELSPDTYSDNNLVKYGKNVSEAVGHPVRIEVRKVKGVRGSAQIAVRGVFGVFRDNVLEQIQEHKDYDEKKYYIRLSGNASFEINRKGVDKALPIQYFFYNWPEVLAMIQYTPGSRIDSSKTSTLITADGDGTTFDSPRLNKAPGLGTSRAYKHLLKYLELGGVYVIISGNHLDRTVSRVQNFIPQKVMNRLLIAANGGANLIYFSQDGRVKEVLDYRENGLNCKGSRKKRVDLDLIYIGDDGRLSGNDREAFEAVGADRAILVAKDKSDDIIPFLEPNYIGGLEAGTTAVLEFVNQRAVSKPGEKIFTKSNIDQMVQMARQQ
ncbi:MAG: hypothetical protein AB7S78_06995 [Candidatus Omnitrophota bacterium]